MRRRTTICADAWNQTGTAEVSFSCRSAASGSELNDADVKMATIERAASMGFKGGQSADARSLGIGVETAQTITNKCSGVEPTMCRISRGVRIGEVVRRNDEVGREVAGCLVRSDGRLGDNAPSVIRTEADISETGKTETRNTKHETKGGEETMKAEVRRLTTKECERLMGFPDGYTECMGGDAARYAACGNSWASNCARRVIMGIHRVDEKVEGAKKEFRYGTISSGVECHTLASRGTGDRAAFFSEISPAPVALLKDHYPDVPNLGDMTLVDYDEEKKCVHNRHYDGYTAPDPAAMGFKPFATDGVVKIPCEKGEIDLVSGGTPCQSFSLAGKRAGGAEGSGTRSALAFQLPRIGKAVGARWLVWENVPGAFSSNGGRDFAWFAYRMAEAGYSLAWRTLDAQYVRTDSHPRAVPQRRRRIWMVAHKGGDWRVPCEVLFEPKKVLGDEPPKRTVGVGFTADMKRASDGGGETWDDKGALDDFKDFIRTADGKMVSLLVERGICASPEKRMAELEEKENGGASGDAGGDLFGGLLLGGAENGGEKRGQGAGLRACDLDLRMPDDGDIRSVPRYALYEWAKSVSKEVCFCGELLRPHEGEAVVDDLDARMLENIGNAGILSGGVCVTMKMPEWNAGLTEEELAAMPRESAALYDGDVCGLSDVLEDEPDAKYLLSWRGAYGILRRAAKRGKLLPLELGYALLSRVVAQAEKVKWVAKNGRDSAKNDGDLSERQVAKTAYDDFVSPFRPWDGVAEVAPGETEAADAEPDGADGNEQDGGEGDCGDGEGE